MLTAHYWISSASLHPPPSVARSAGFTNVFAWLVLGFRCAPPQALRCHPLRGLRIGSAACIHSRQEIRVDSCDLVDRSICLNACWCTPTKLCCRTVDHRFEETWWESFEANLLVGIVRGNLHQVVRPVRINPNGVIPAPA